MKNVGIVTINDNDNYGNKLQNYATQEVLKKINTNPTTIRNRIRNNNVGSRTLKNSIKNVLHDLLNLSMDIRYRRLERRKLFHEFNKNIKFTNKLCVPNEELGKEYDYFVAGSDQIWKPTYGRMRDMDLLNFTENRKKISFAASFGISQLPEESKNFFKERVKDFKAISVREEAGKKIVEDLTNRKDVEVLIDPTMLLNSEEWDKVARKPKKLDTTKKYILNYFLGELSETRKKEINRIASENNCEVINILDCKNPFYQTGPSEFLYLEKNAFLICTDSFHSCVFAVLYDRPFIVFEREGNRVNMSSRIETLINKFNLKDRKFEDKITNKNLEHDYKEAYEILEKERIKSLNFLKKALGVE